jgi:hypothetical protein
MLLQPQNCNMGRYNIGLLQDRVYRIFVRTFQNEKYISIGKDGFGITEIDDIGEVYHTTTIRNEHKLVNAVVAGVRSLDKFSACYSCAGRLLNHLKIYTMQYNTNIFFMQAALDLQDSNRI